MKINNSFTHLFLTASLVMILFFTGCGGDSSSGDSSKGDDPGFTVSAAALSSSSIRIDWTPHRDATSYWVFYSAKANPTFSDLSMIYNGNAAARTHVASGLKAGTTYYFRVYINDTNGSYKDASAATLPKAPPVASMLVASGCHRTLTRGCNSDGDGVCSAI